MSEGLGVSIRRTVVTTMTAALIVVAVLTGCSDDEKEPPDSGLPSKTETTDPTTPASSTTPTPTEPSATGPQPPALPAAAKADTKQGAQAFVAYYIKLLNYASLTGDGSSLLKYGPQCRVCKSEARFYDKTYRNGGWFKGGIWTPDPRTWFITPSGRGFFVAVNVDTAPGKQRVRRGGEVTRFRADRLRINAQITRDGNRWQVSSLSTPG
jgi:hypothetical protein